MNMNYLVKFCNDNNCELKVSRKGIMKVSRDSKGHFVSEPFEMPEKRAARSRRTDEEVRNAFESSKTCREMSAKLGMSYSGTLVRCRKMGLSFGRVARSNVSDAQVLDAINKLGSCLAAAKTLKVSNARASKVAKASGIEVKRGRPAKFSTEQVREVFDQNDGNITRTAEQLGIAAATVRKAVRR